MGGEASPWFCWREHKFYVTLCGHTSASHVPLTHLSPSMPLRLRDGATCKSARKSMCSPVTLDLCLFVHSYETEQKSDPVQRSDLLVSTLFTCATHCTCLITILVFCLEKYINAHYHLKSFLLPQQSLFQVF